jgi:hypothetical protein
VVPPEVKARILSNFMGKPGKVRETKNDHGKVRINQKVRERSGNMFGQGKLPVQQETGHSQSRPVQFALIVQQRVIIGISLKS